MKNIKLLALTFILLITTTGCATIFGGGSDENLSVESSEPLKIKIVGSDGQVIHKSTPFSIQMERGQNYTVKIQSDKYESDDIYLGRKVRTLAFLNLFCLLCWVIDFATGNVWEHKMHHVFIDTKDLNLKKAMGLNSFDSLITVNIKGTEPGKDKAETQISGNVHFVRI